MDEIEIVANGEKHRLPGGTTVAAYIAGLGVPGGRVAVEVNLKLVPKDRFDVVVLASGDRVEVVTLVGGG